MKCPKCGKELEEGKLLCENCGEEIKIVPEYDIELEDKLSESISSMMEEMSSQDLTNDNSQDSQDDLNDNVDLGDDEFYSSFNDKSKKNIIIIFAIAVIIVLFAFIVKMSEDSLDNSYDYQYNKALENAANGDYNEAASYLERALAISPDDIDSRFLLAQYYDKNGQEQSAITLLNEILNVDENYSRRDEVYDMLLEMYQNRGEYTKMGELLKGCEIERILSKYNEYAALEPTFNKEGGIYDKLISIALYGNTKGFVYYTTDGSTPTCNSAVYETPILLESGDYIIRAMFVNQYGVQSDVVTQNYYINLSVPEAPIVEPESGIYSAPSMIDAYYGNTTKIYYTTDGSVPDRKSTRYNGAIEMPYGISNFSFIAIDDSGVSSDVVNRTYQLEIRANFSTDLAITVLKNNLWAKGVLANVDGNVPGKLGYNQYAVSTLYGAGETIYYIVSEEYVDTMGKAHETSNYYAIDVETADLYTAYKLDEGKYNLIPLL